MTRVDEFDAFYTSTQRVTLVTTYAKCGDRDVAREATIEAYRHAWRQWSRVSSGDPSSFVRAEAWKGTALSRGTHPWRRRRTHDTDTALLDQLTDLDQPSRRLISLMTIADVDLDEAAREVGVDDESALELASRGFSRIEEGLGATIDEVVERMRALAVVTAGLDLPTAAEVRRSATRGARRNAVLLVAAALALVMFGGAFVSQGDATARQSSLPDREKIGAESRDVVLDSHNIGTDDLLSTEAVSALRPDAAWTVEGTDTDPANQTPYATCPTTRFADPDPLKVFVRAFTDDRGRSRRPVDRGLALAGGLRGGLRPPRVVLRGLRASAHAPRRRLPRRAAVRRLPDPAPAVLPLAEPVHHGGPGPVRHPHQHARARVAGDEAHRRAPVRPGAERVDQPRVRRLRWRLHHPLHA